MADKTNTLRELLAEREHARWARWQAWVHKIFREQFSPEIMEVIEPVLERWERQIATPYKDLSESEKDSDRKEADEILSTIYSSLEKELPKKGPEADVMESQEIMMGGTADQIEAHGFVIGYNQALRDVKDKLERLLK